MNSSKCLAFYVLVLSLMVSCSTARKSSSGHTIIIGGEEGGGGGGGGAPMIISKRNGGNSAPNVQDSPRGADYFADYISDFQRRFEVAVEEMSSNPSRLLGPQRPIMPTMMTSMSSPYQSMQRPAMVPPPPPPPPHHMHQMHHHPYHHHQHPASHHQDPASHHQHPASHHQQPWGMYPQAPGGGYGMPQPGPLMAAQTSPFPMYQSMEEPWPTTAYDQHGNWL